MKKICLTFLMLTFSIFSFAQSASDVKITMGSEVKGSKRSTLSDIIGFDETGIYVLRTRVNSYSKFSVEHYDDNMNLTKSQEIELETDGKDRDFEFLLQMNNKLYLFSSFHNQKLKKNFLFVENIDKSTLLPANNLKKIAEIDYERRGNRGSFNYKLSKDENTLLVLYNLPFEKGGEEKFGFHVYDKNMQEMWSKNIALPYNDELFGVTEFKVDNKGNAYVLGKLYNEKAKEKVRGKVNYTYTILSYAKDGKKAEYKIDMQDKFLMDMQIAISDKEDIICAGFYSDKGTYSIKGTYFLTVDGKTKDVKKKSFKEFGLEFITQNMSEKEEAKTKKKAAKGKDVEMYEYDLDDLILRSDGGAILVGEQYYTYTVTYTTTNANGGTSTRTVTYYNYNDIIVVNMNADGTIAWATKVPKKQVTSNDGGFYSSYTKAVMKDKVYFIYNDSPKNMNVLAKGQVYNFIPGRESVVVLAEVDKSGNVSKQALFTSKEAEMITRPKVCEQIAENELVIFGQKKKYSKFASIILK